MKALLPACYRNGFVNKLTLYNDGRAEIEFNFRDELEEVLLWAAMRKKEVNKYAG